MRCPARVVQSYELDFQNRVRDDLLALLLKRH